MCNLLPCELSQRIRGFSTTMRYINRHYLSIYLSKTSFTLLPSCFSDSRGTACACRRKLNTSKAVTCFRTVDSLSRVLVICWTFTNIRSSSEMAFRQFVSLRDVMNGATHHSRRGDDTPSGVCSLCRPEDLYTATKMLTWHIKELRSSVTLTENSCRV